MLLIVTEELFYCYTTFLSANCGIKYFITGLEASTSSTPHTDTDTHTPHHIHKEKLKLALYKTNNEEIVEFCAMN